MKCEITQFRAICLTCEIFSNRYAVPFESPRKRAFDEPLQYAPKHRREEDRRIGSSGGSTGGGRGREVRREERFERGRDRPRSPPRNYATRREDRSPRGSRGRYGSPPRNGRDRRAPPASSSKFCVCHKMLIILLFKLDVLTLVMLCLDQASLVRRAVTVLFLVEMAERMPTLGCLAIK